MKKQWLSGLAIASLAVSTTVQADDLVKPLEAPTPSDNKSATSKPVTDVDVKKVAEDLAKAKAALLAQQGQVSEYTAAKEEAQQTLTEAKEALEAAKKLLAEATPEALKASHEALALLDNDIVTIQTSISAFETSLAEVGAAINEQDDVIETTKEQLEAESHNLATADAEVTAIETLLDGSQEKSLNEALEKANADLEETDEALAAAEEALEEAKVQDSERETSITLAEQAISNEENKLSETEEALEVANERVSEATLTENHLSLDIAKTQETIKELKAALAVSDTEALRRLEASLTQLAQAQDSVRLAEQALALAQLDDKKRQETIQSLENQLRDSRQELANANANLERLSAAYFNAMPSNQLTGRPYYLQTDPRWINNYYGKYIFGSSGCIPTALAMIYSELSGRSIMPLEVGNWLYNNTSEFNKRYYGTTGKGILMASSHYGFEATPLGHYTNLVNALKEGHIVTATVQENKFAPWGDGTTHQIVLKGYSNGSTYVYDPYTKANEGWYSIQQLWAEQSTDPIDTVGVGAPFIKITLPGVTALKTNLDAAKNTQATLVARVSRATTNLTQLQSVVSQTTNRQAALDTAKANETEANNRVTLARTALDKASQDKASLNQSLNNAQAKLTSLTTTHQAAQGVTEKARQAQTTAQTAYNSQSNRLLAAKQALAALKAKPAHQPVAEETLARARQAKQQAEATHAQIGQRLALLAKTQEEKESELAQAKEKQAQAQATLAQAKADLLEEIAKLKRLTDEKARLEVAVTDAKASLATTSDTLSKARKAFEALQHAPETLAKAEEIVKEAESTLALREADLTAALALLEQLETAETELENQHKVVLDAYRTYLASVAYASRQKESLSGQDLTPLPVVTDQGKLVAYQTTDKASPQPLSVSGQQPTYSRVAKQRQLPKTGDEVAYGLVALGTVLSGFGLVGLKRQK